MDLMSKNPLVDLEQLRTVAEKGKQTPKQYGELLKQTVLTGMSPENAAIAIRDIARLELCPISKHLAFLMKGGKLQTGITVDGWYEIARREGITKIDRTYTTHEDGDVSCRVIVARPGEEGYVAEDWLSEVKMNTPVWKKMPRRMLGHRAVIQALRSACGTYACASAEELIDVGFTDQATPVQAQQTEISLPQLKTELKQHCDDHKLTKSHTSKLKVDQKDGEYRLNVPQKPTKPLIETIEKVWDYLYEKVRGNLHLDDGVSPGTYSQYLMQHFPHEWLIREVGQKNKMLARAINRHGRFTLSGHVDKDHAFQHDLGLTQNDLENNVLVEALDELAGFYGHVDVIKVDQIGVAR